MLRLPTPTATHQLTTFDPQEREKVVTIDPGASCSLEPAQGPGFLAKLWITFPGWFWAHWEPERPVDQAVLKTLIVKIYVDDADTPQVCAPAGDLFGLGLGEMSSFAATWLGVSSGGFYLGFPMPFRSSLRIEFENRHPTMTTKVFCNALYQSVAALDDDTPYFHGFFATGRNSGPEPLELASTNARGRYVGCTLSCQGEKPNYLSFLEAPEYVYLDGRDDPTIIGTGMEDYFLGGWYFREGTFAGPDHGVPVKDALSSSVAMYRIHTWDAIHFEHDFRMTFQTPWSPDRLRPFAHSSVAFLYLDRPEPAPAVPGNDDLLCWYRTRPTDHQSIP